MQSLSDAALESPCKRPLPYMTFALNHVVHGLNPAGFRVVNIVIHFLSAVFLYLFFKTTLSLPALAGAMERPRLVAGFSALIWALHPVQTQSVSYVVQRMNSMSGMFFILALFLYAHSRTGLTGKVKAIGYAAGFASFACALASKENALILPVIILFYEWFFIQDLSSKWLKSKAWILAGFLVFLILFGLLQTGFKPIEWMAVCYSSREFTLWERLLTELRVVAWYLSLTAAPLPWRLHLLHDFPLSSSLFNPLSTLWSLLFLAGLLAGAFALAKRHRLFSFAIFWFLGCLVIESSIIPLEIIYEHRLYVPTMLPALLPVVLANRLLKSNKALIAFLCCVTACLGGLTHYRNMQWGDGVSLLENDLAVSDSARTHYNLGHVLFLKGNLERSVVEYEAGFARDGKALESAKHDNEKLEIKTRMASSYNTLAAAHIKLQDAQKAMTCYEKALELEPDHYLARKNLGLLLAKTGRVHESIVHFRKTIELNPEMAENYANLADALVALGRFEKAIDNYGKALEIQPDSARFNDSMARMMVSRGEMEKAAAHFTKTLETDPDYPGARQALEGVRQADMEISRLKAAIKASPNDPDGPLKLAKLYQQLSNKDGAIKYFIMGFNALGVRSLEANQLEQAEASFNKALSLDGQNKQTLHNLARLHAVKKGIAQNSGLDN